MLRTIVIGLCGVLGCAPAEPSPRPTEFHAPAEPRNRQATSPTGTTPPTATTWHEALWIDDAPAGRIVTRHEPLSAGEAVVSQRTEINLVRAGELVRQAIEITSAVDSHNQLLWFRSETSTAGQSPSVTLGAVEDHQLVVRFADGAPEVHLPLPEKVSVGDAFFVQREFWQRPPQKGDQRSIYGFLPLVNRVARVELTAHGAEPVTVFDKTVSLQRVEAMTFAGTGHDYQQTLWVDADGQIVKTEIARPWKQVAMIVSAGQSSQLLSGAEFNLDRRASIELASSQSLDLHAWRVVYHVRRRSVGDPRPLRPTPFTSDHRQRVTTIADGWRVEVDASADLPSAIAPESAAALPSPAELASSHLVSSQAPAIRQLAASVLPDEIRPQAVVDQLVRTVYARISDKNYQHGLISAAEVLTLRAGDCTEHAVLLTALCRARQIPARVAVGLVFDPQHSALVYHMWNEVWIDDGWRPVDSTRADGQISVSHLKMSDNSLADESASDAMLPVLDWLGELEIEVESVETAARQ